MTTGQVRLESDGSSWRPLVHIEDISRAFLAVLEGPRELVHNEAFNVGRPEDNVQVRDIADLVRDAVPESEVRLAEDAGPDLRNYRVDFSKLAETFPIWTCAGGCRTALMNSLEPTPGMARVTTSSRQHASSGCAGYVSCFRLTSLMNYCAARPAGPSQRQGDGPTTGRSGHPAGYGADPPGVPEAE